MPDPLAGSATPATPWHPYADRPGRRARQLVADLGTVLWTALWSWLAWRLHGFVAGSAQIGYTLRDGAGGLSDQLRSAGSGVGRVPLVGDPLATPLDAAGGAAGQVAAAGAQLGDGIAGSAAPVALLVLTVAVLPVVVPWLVLRIRYARTAGAVLALRGRPGGVRLLALRALATQSPRRLLGVHPDPVIAWEAGDPAVTEALAALELRSLGLLRR